MSEYSDMMAGYRDQRPVKSDALAVLLDERYGAVMRQPTRLPDWAKLDAAWLRAKGIVVLPPDHPLRTAPLLHGALWELALAAALREARLRRLSAHEVDNKQLLEAQIGASLCAALAVLRES